MANKKFWLRVLVVLLVVALVFGVIYSAFAQTAEVDESKMTANAIVLFDQDTGTIIYSKNADEKIAPASTTKLMTAVLTLENGNLDDVVKVGKEVEISGSIMGLHPGDKVTVRNLMHGMMLNSGNDAATALAVHISGSVEKFAELMNEKAKEIGMTGTHFITPSGKDAEGHLVTAADMVKLTRYALQFDEIKKIVTIQNETVKTEDGKRSFTLSNTNRLINSGEGIGNGKDYKYKYCTGMKTGSTPNAKKCLVATAEKDGKKLGVLIYGDGTEDGVDRWSIAPYLFDYGFENYVNVDISKKVNTESIRVNVQNAAVSETLDGTVACKWQMDTDTPVITVSKEDAEKECELQVYKNPMLTAPIQAGQNVGTVRVVIGDQVVYSTKLVAAEDVMSQEDYDNLVVKPVDPEAVDEPVSDPSILASMWWWILIPVALIIFLVVRAIILRRRHHRFSKKKTKMNRYRGKRF